MESNDQNQYDGENNEVPNSQELDIYNNLEVILKARNKIICRKEITLPCVTTDDTDYLDILDDDEFVQQVPPNNHLQRNEQTIKMLRENIRKLKNISEKEIDFVIDEESNQNDELNQELSIIRQQSEKLFKNIINVQVSFNECLNNLEINDGEKKNFVKKHTKLIEDTCKFDRGIEAVVHCDKQLLENHIQKELKIDGVEELKNSYNELAQGILSTVYDNGMKTFKKHEHLLAIKQYNKPLTDVVVDMEKTGKLDPFTKQLIIRPVINKVCKHIYDQDSLSLMFQTKTFISCPYIGCTNKHFTKNDILYDLDISNKSD